MDKRHYCSFLLSLKQVQTEDLQTWIVALRNVHTGHQQIFSNLNGLIQFLETEFGDPAEQKDTGRSDPQNAQVDSIREHNGRTELLKRNTSPERFSV